MFTAARSSSPILIARLKLSFTRTLFGLIVFMRRPVIYFGELLMTVSGRVQWVITSLKVLISGLSVLLTRRTLIDSSGGLVNFLRFRRTCGLSRLTGWQTGRPLRRRCFLKGKPVSLLLIFLTMNQRKYLRSIQSSAVFGQSRLRLSPS